SGIAEILIRDVVKCLRAVRRSHSVDLRNDETEFGQWLCGDGEALRDEISLRPGIDRLDYRIFPRRIEFQRPVYHSPNIRFPITRQRLENFRRSPPCGSQG